MTLEPLLKRCQDLFDEGISAQRDGDLRTARHCYLEAAHLAFTAAKGSMRRKQELMKRGEHLVALAEQLGYDPQVDDSGSNSGPKKAPSQPLDEVIASSPTLHGSGEGAGDDPGGGRFDGPAILRKDWVNAWLQALPNSQYHKPMIDQGKFRGISKLLGNHRIKLDATRKVVVHVGPQASVVHLPLAPGTTVQKLHSSLPSLKLDLGSTHDLSLSTHEVPGFASLFIPHPERVPVPLFVFLDDLPETYELPIPLGIRPDNQVQWLDLTKTNHLLVAGSTGSGKTVYLQGLVAVLAGALPPDELDLYLVDPKQLDLTAFNDLPHCPLNVITDPEDVHGLLDVLWAEVEARKVLLRHEGATNVVDYRASKGAKSLPFVVAVIDEYYDLLLSLDKKVERDRFEEKICRLAQVGRALGIYLVLATQRPSADVVSGRIKANFPTRLAFRLPSHHDSGVILDEPGAEDLLPGGDGLMAGMGGLKRFQAFLVTPEDCKGVVKATATALNAHVP